MNQYALPNSLALPSLPRQLTLPGPPRRPTGCQHPLSLTRHFSPAHYLQQASTPAVLVKLIGRRVEPRAVHGGSRAPPSRASLREAVLLEGLGGDESERHGAESQWIVAARPLCHLQYPVAYLSRLQRILPAARWELYFKAARAALSPRGLGQRHVPPGPRGPYCRSAIGRRAHASHLARILT